MGPRIPLARSPGPITGTGLASCKWSRTDRARVGPGTRGRLAGRLLELCGVPRNMPTDAGLRLGPGTIGSRSISSGAGCRSLRFAGGPSGIAGGMIAPGCASPAGASASGECRKTGMSFGVGVRNVKRAAPLPGPPLTSEPCRFLSGFVRHLHARRCRGGSPRERAAASHGAGALARGR